MSARSASNQLADPATRTGLTIPPTAHLIGIEDENRVLAQKSAGAPIHGIFCNKAWWDPHAAQRLRTGQAERKPGMYLNIGVDDSDPDAVSVYIVQHGT